MRGERGQQINLDLGRLHRCGHPEVVYSPGKTPEQVADALRGLHRAHGVALATRVDPAHVEEIIRLIPDLHYDPTARLLRLGSPLPRSSSRSIAVVSAGTSDSSVAEEGGVTLETFGIGVERFRDVGVAGLHRLLSVVEDIRQCDAVIVVAGMEGALPSVVAGLIDLPVIAVPTSTGYGVGAGGTTALHGMLSSCAAGVVVVNIDNGFGAAMSVMRLLSLDRDRTNRETSVNENG